MQRIKWILVNLVYWLLEILRGICVCVGVFEVFNVIIRALTLNYTNWFSFLTNCIILVITCTIYYGITEIVFWVKNNRTELY